jgi:glucosamine-6-phosphate deaminase
VEIIYVDTPEEGQKLAAEMLAQQVCQKPNSVLGLATGNTMIGVYEHLSQQQVDFSGVTTFNLDEYVGLSPEDPNSYHYYMREHLFRKVNLRPSHCHVPDGSAQDIPAACQAYEEAIKAAGGIDLQLLGIGEDGHIAFNEPTSSLASRTRLKTLTPVTLAANRLPEGQAPPSHVITMGVATIMEARRCLLLAFGRRKAQIVIKFIEGPITSMVPATALQMHPATTVIVDEEAGRFLSLRDYYKLAYSGKPAWQKA